MSNYKIKDIQQRRAKKLNVEIKSSTRKNKKIDVFKNGKKIASIGGVYPDGRFYGDYATYNATKGKTFADTKRRLYRLRHAGEEKKIGSGGFYAWFILW